MNNKRVIAGVVGLLVLSLLLLWQRGEAGQAVDEAKKEPRHIHSSGSATVRVKPDSARVFFSVITMAPTIKEARNDNGARVKKVLDALGALKIPDLKMKSSDVNVDLVHSRNNHDELPRVIGYRITNSFTVLVTSDDVTKLNAGATRVLDTALENGVNNVQQIVFFRKDLVDARRQALTKAVEEATANAKALAAGAKVNLSDTVSISGQPEYYYRDNNRAQVQNAFAPGGGGEGDTPIVAGDLEVSCSVSVTCSY